MKPARPSTAPVGPMVLVTLCMALPGWPAEAFPNAADPDENWEAEVRTTLAAEEVAERGAADVLHFLSELFEDRVLLWKSPDGRSGGWCTIGSDGRFSLMDSGDETFLWSGPVTTPESR